MLLSQNNMFFFLLYVFFSHKLFYNVVLVIQELVKMIKIFFLNESENTLPYRELQHHIKNACKKHQKW